MDNNEIKQEKKLATIDEAIEMLYSGQVCKSTFIRNMEKENWPVYKVCSKKFIPMKFLMAKLEEIEAAADAAISLQCRTKEIKEATQKALSLINER